MLTFMNMICNQIAFIPLFPLVSFNLLSFSFISFNLAFNYSELILSMFVKNGFYFNVAIFAALIIFKKNNHFGLNFVSVSAPQNIIWGMFYICNYHTQIV